MNSSIRPSIHSDKTVKKGTIHLASQHVKENLIFKFQDIINSYAFDRFFSSLGMLCISNLYLPTVSPTVQILPKVEVTMPSLLYYRKRND